MEPVNDVGLKHVPGGGQEVARVLDPCAKALKV